MSLRSLSACLVLSQAVSQLVSQDQDEVETEEVKPQDPPNRWRRSISRTPGGEGLPEEQLQKKVSGP